ncbi:MAG: alpha/beta hydrolase, partial [Salegentibacter sp.]
MKKLLFLFFSIIAVQNISAQEAFQEKDITVNKFIDGTLTTPAAGQARSLVIFVQGSGPTDRNGNQPMMKSDFAKKIAHQLAGNDIASFRF